MVLCRSDRSESFSLFSLDICQENKLSKLKKIGGEVDCFKTDAT
jgi:hypothetical protein